MIRPSIHAQPDECGVYSVTTLPAPAPPSRDRFTEDRDALFTQMRFEAGMRFNVRDVARWTTP